jgi:MFS family permease
MGDWLQGPYVYALYSNYHFTKQQIGVLFIVGFGSSMVFGVLIGSLTDRYGRKLSCLAYCFTYILSCATKHSSNFNILLFGRLLGGAAYSILFTSFDSWLISEHNKKAFPAEWLNQTFQYATICNGVTAIAAGQLGSWVRDYFDSLVAPFDAAIVFLTIAAVVIFFNWNENCGVSSGDNSALGKRSKFIIAMELLQKEPKFAVLGMIQSFFEGAMFIVIFMWTPKLEPHFPGLPHGQVFGCFMACTMLGSCCVDYLTRWAPPESYLRYVFLLSAATMTFPATKLSSGMMVLVSFLAFEFCCGVFWPSKGIVKSHHVPEEVRATMYNIFRVPLNLIVCIVLSNLEATSDEMVFTVVCGLLFASALMQHVFLEMVRREKDKFGGALHDKLGLDHDKTSDGEEMVGTFFESSITKKNVVDGDSISMLVRDE